MLTNSLCLFMLLSLHCHGTKADPGSKDPFANIHRSHEKYFRFEDGQFPKTCSKGARDCTVEQPESRPQTLMKEAPCWGHEKGCKLGKGFSYPECYSHDPRWASTIAEQQKIFWDQADFGYLKNFLNGMMDICKPLKPDGSSLRCAENLFYCEARNLYMNFKNSNFAASNDRYKEDLFQPGDIGGHCEFDEKLHRLQGARKSPLQSWFAELENYSYIDENPIDSGMCDVVLSKPTFFIKLDAGINMYHHFCDFVNLYASQHMNGSFSTDVYIVMWDTSNYGYGDFFEETWKVFTDHPIIRLDQYDRKRLCVKQAVFPLLARMVRGLYYNMPLVPGCRKSGLFKAFSEHVLHRLRIMQDSYQNESCRVTFLSRKTKFRNILNQDELIGAMKRYPFLNVTEVEYKPSLSFLTQLQITHNTDIFIGIHGAGLTHSLFLPDWAVLFELYNTEDADCYRDIARLRGVEYLTWQNKDKLFQQDKGHHPTLGEHPKFTNYAFNVDEFMRILEKAIKHVMKKRPKRDYS